MDYISTVLLAAKKVGVSGSLLLAICSHESGGFKHTHNPDDRGTPSYGACQVKEATAQQLGYKLTEKQLANPKTNALIAAKYLKWQLDRYQNNYCRAVAAYNSGTYNESKKKPGYPMNLKYVEAVKDLIEEENERKLLDCEQLRRATI